MHATDDTARLARHLGDESATLELGRQLANALRPGMTIYLEGDLGAGKTTLVRGMLRALGHAGRVKSPTYTLAETYTFPSFELYHFDLYRMHDPREWLDAGFRETADSGTVRLIEWPDRAAGWLPAPDVRVRLTVVDDGREAECLAETELGRSLLERCRKSC
jgi:tRNA threonylcarbamoyladenosine biosynthesis protein TsaE